MELLIGTLIIVASLIALVKIFEMETKVELAKLGKEEDPKKRDLRKEIIQRMSPNKDSSLLRYLTREKHTHL